MSLLSGSDCKRACLRVQVFIGYDVIALGAEEVRSPAACSYAALLIRGAPVVSRPACTLVIACLDQTPDMIAPLLLPTVDVQVGKLVSQQMMPSKQLHAQVESSCLLCKC